MPGELVAVVERALAKDPADRFVDAAAMRQSLHTPFRDQLWVLDVSAGDAMDTLARIRSGASA